MRTEDAPSVSRLNAQLEALEALRAAGGDADTIPEDHPLSNAAVKFVRAWAVDRRAAAEQFSFQRLRPPQIRGVLTQPNRSTVAEGWLRLLRAIHTETPPGERMASAYGATWPQRPGPTATPPTASWRRAHCAWAPV